MSKLRTQLAAIGCILALVFVMDATAAPGDIEKEFERGAMAHRMRDYQTAYKIWLSLAEKGQIDAQYNIARMLQDGDGAPQNLVEAAKWFRKAAEQGDKESQYYLGLMYLRGDGVATDEKEAQKWFAMNRKHHAMHHDMAQWEKWQRQLAEMNGETPIRQASLQNMIH